MGFLVFFVLVAVFAVGLGIWRVVKHDLDDPCCGCDMKIHTNGCRGCEFEGWD